MKPSRCLLLAQGLPRLRVKQGEKVSGLHVGLKLFLLLPGLHLVGARSPDRAPRSTGGLLLLRRETSGRGRGARSGDRTPTWGRSEVSCTPINAKHALN